jgi:hypothetical protein
VHCDNTRGIDQTAIAQHDLALARDEGLFAEMGAASNPIGLLNSTRGSMKGDSSW